MHACPKQGTTDVQDTENNTYLLENMLPVINIEKLLT